MEMSIIVGFNLYFFSEGFIYNMVHAIDSYDTSR